MLSICTLKYLLGTNFKLIFAIGFLKLPDPHPWTLSGDQENVFKDLLSTVQWIMTSEWFWPWGILKLRAAPAVGGGRRQWEDEIQREGDEEGEEVWNGRAGGSKCSPGRRGHCGLFRGAWWWARELGRRQEVWRADKSHWGSGDMRLPVMVKWSREGVGVGGPGRKPRNTESFNLSPKNTLERQRNTEKTHKELRGLGWLIGWQSSNK